MATIGRGLNRRLRIIDALRRHAELRGEWRYDRDMNEWRRNDGVRVYARSRLRMCCYDSCDHASSHWYVEYPVHGPVPIPRTFAGSWEHVSESFAFESGRLPGYVEEIYFLRGALL